jgi:glycine/D-amino acid oxidase-like deaminating enzyme
MSSKQSAQGTFDRQHAVVIGASMAGLLAARVLSDHFEQVTIIERDQLNRDAEPRIILAVLRRELAAFRRQPTVTAPASEVSMLNPLVREHVRHRGL